MRTKYCPHCCSEKIHRVEEADGSHYHECEECDETWSHHTEPQVVPVGLPSWQTKD
jgi:transposase-like protein